MISSRIQETLDPCVVLLKQWIEQYSEGFCYPTSHAGEDEDDEHDGEDDTTRHLRNTILSLAQGVVYWKPPPTSSRLGLTLQKMLSSTEGDDHTLLESLHCYGPATGLPEFVDLLQSKIRNENSLRRHKVMVTAGANQAYMNVVLCLLDENNHNGGGGGNDGGNGGGETGGETAGGDDMSSPPKAVVFRPYYFNHVMAIQMVAGNEAVLVGPSCETTGIPDVDWLERQLVLDQNQNHHNNIRVVTVVNPGNPTGVTIPRATMQRLVDLTRLHKIWLVIDCTYEYFTVDRTNDQPIFTAGKSSGGSDNNDDDNNNNNNGNENSNSHVIHIFSFSKSYSLAGYRVGYVVVHEDAVGDTTTSLATSTDDTTSTAISTSGSCSSSSTSLWDQMLKVQDTILISPSRITQYVAMAAMSTTTTTPPSGGSSAGSGGGGGGKQWVYEQYDTLRESRQLILDALTTSNNLHTIGGSGSMYVMAKLPSLLSSSSSSSAILTNDDNDDDEESTTTAHVMDDVEICRLLVQRYGIAIIPGTFCGFKGWIRVCYANLHPNITKVAAKRLKHGLRQLIAEQQNENKHAKTGGETNNKTANSNDVA